MYSFRQKKETFNCDRIKNNKLCARCYLNKNEKIKIELKWHYLGAFIPILNSISDGTRGSPIKYIARRTRD